MPAEDPALLRFLARWDRDAEALRAAVSELAGREVHFGRDELPPEREALFALFDRDPLGAVTQREDGSWVMPWNPWSAYRHIVEERYLPPKGPPLHARIPLPYHMVPGHLRLAVYPLIAGRSGDHTASPPSPAWPAEGRLDTFQRRLFAGITGEEPRACWPGGKRYPLLMTHDIDTKEGMKLAGQVLDEMVEIGVKPCFFLVGRGYDWDEGFCDAVRQAGGEIGLHGDVHDNRISYLSASAAAKRLDRCRDKLVRHGILGFRAPSLLVSDALYEAVGPRFAWDSSVPDTDTNTLLGPRRGCGTVFPFRRGRTLVLPTTMPADDRLLLLGYKGLDLLKPLRAKWQHVRQMGGLCHFITHPEPHLFGRPIVRDLYKALLKEILDSREAWVATPSMVAEYWRSVEAEQEAA
jgi:hypothetical protein